MILDRATPAAEPTPRDFTYNPIETEIPASKLMAASHSGGSGEQSTPPSLQQLFLSGWETRRRLEACEVTAKSPEYSV